MAFDRNKETLTNDDCAIRLRRIGKCGINRIMTCSYDYINIDTYI